MTTIGSEVQCGEFLRFSSSLDAASAWEVGAAGDIGTVIHDVKQEIEADGCHDGSLPWLSDSATALENYPNIIMPLKREKRTFSDILRDVKMREDTLQCAVARLGGGAKGLQVLMEHVSYWALEAEDEDVTATIRRGIADLGMPLAPKRHCNPEISAKNDDGNGDDPCFDASPVGPGETMNHGAAYTRALRKSHMVRQRGQTRVRRHPSMSKYGNRSRQWRISGSHECSPDMDHKLSDENGKVNRLGYEFLFQKELRASDVSSLGRIVLPKKDAERHLPFLVVREGIVISLEDYHCGKLWTARYRFWPNNKSRMYLLENIGDFVNFHHLQEGDLLLCYRNEQGGYVIRGQKVPPNVKSPAEGLIFEDAQVRENSPTRKSETKVMPVTHQFVFRNGTHNANLADSPFDSLNCTLGEGDDAKYFQNECSRQQDCFSQQSGYPSCGGDVLMSGFPESRTPPVHDCDFDPEVDMLSVNNVKNQFMEDNQFLE